MANSLSQLIFPQRCISCSVLGERICELCRREWVVEKLVRNIPSLSPQSIRVISATRYTPIARKVLLAAKEDGVKSADALLLETLNHAASMFHREKRFDFLVPMPSRRSASRQRGRIFMESITRNLARQLEIPMMNLLIHTREVQDQSELHLQQRRNNLNQAFVVSRADIDQSVLFQGGRALLVDDLITTGSTLGEGARALSAAGIEVVGAITACSAQSMRPIR